MKSLSGYRTIIFIVISFILKALVAKNLLGPDAVMNSDMVTDAVLMVVSGVSDLVAVWFRLRATKPGPLAPTT